MKSKLIIFFLIIISLFSSYFIGKRTFYYESGLPQNRRDIIPQKPGFLTYTINIKELNKNMVALFRLLPHDTSDIVFLGTSLTQGFPLVEAFKDVRLKNRGIGGNTIADILNRLNEVTDGKPAKIFLEVGVNDIAKSPTDSVFKNFLKIITFIKSKTPKTKIYVQSVLPFGNSITPIIEDYNSKTKSYSLSNQLIFINLYPSFLGNKSLKKELTTDGTHLTAKGYILWKKLLTPYLQHSF